MSNYNVKRLEEEKLEIKQKTVRLEEEKKEIKQQMLRLQEKKQ